jgi:hypothetical protein
MPERMAHLYACQGLSTYRAADLAGISRQRGTRLLHRTGVAVKPQGAGRRRGSGAGQFPPEFLAVLYRQLRLSCAEISVVTGVPARTVRDRLVASGVRMRTRGGSNREDRTVLDPARLAVMYLQAGLTAGEIGQALGVSRRLVLRTAHDEGFPVRVGGPPPPGARPRLSSSAPSMPTRRCAGRCTGTACRRFHRAVPSGSVSPSPCP